MKCEHCGISMGQCYDWQTNEKVRQRCCNFCTHWDHHLPTEASA